MDRQEYFKLLKDKYDTEIEVLEEWKNKHVDWTFEIYESSDGRNLYCILEGNNKHPDFYNGVYVDEYDYAERLQEIIRDELNDGDTILWLTDDDIEEYIDWEELAEELEEDEEETITKN